METLHHLWVDFVSATQGPGRMSRLFFKLLSGAEEAEEWRWLSPQGDSIFYSLFRLGCKRKILPLLLCSVVFIAHCQDTPGLCENELRLCIKRRTTLQTMSNKQGGGASDTTPPPPYNRLHLILAEQMDFLRARRADNVQFDWRAPGCDVADDCSALLYTTGVGKIKKNTVTTWIWRRDLSKKKNWKAAMGSNCEPVRAIWRWLEFQDVLSTVVGFWQVCEPLL